VALRKASLPQQCSYAFERWPGELLARVPSLDRTFRGHSTHYISVSARNYCQGGLGLRHDLKLAQGPRETYVLLGVKALTR
jgi:hypothetical protein